MATHDFFATITQIFDFFAFLKFTKVGKFAACTERLKTKSASASGWLRPPDPLINAWRAPLAWCHWSSTIWARSAHVSMSPWNCSAVLDGQLYNHSRSHWPSTSAFCHSAEVGRTALLTEQFWSSALFCGGPVDLEFAARQSSQPRTESRYFQTSAEDIHFCEILMTKCI